VLKELDWKTRAGAARFAHHWRVLSCMALGVLSSTFLLYQLAPHSFWFMILWAGGTTGSVLGLLLGLPWQLQKQSRWATTSGRFILVGLLGWGAMALLAAFLLWPALQDEEALRQTFRSLSSQHVAAIDLDTAGRHVHYDSGTDAISDFITTARASELFYSSHEISIVEFVITLHFGNGAAMACQGRVPERHTADLALKCPGSLAGEVLIPDGRRWLDGSRGTGPDLQ